MLKLFRHARPAASPRLDHAAVLAAVWILFLNACSSAAQPRPPAPSDVVATVGSASITLAEVDAAALQVPAETFGGLTLSQALYEARRSVLDDLVGNALLDQEAKSRGVDRAAVVSQEILSKVAAPTEGEVAAWYNANPTRVQGASLEQVRDPIRSFLVDERTRQARNEYLDRLKTKTGVKILLEPPRQTLTSANSPSKGPAKAPVELVEFSDFQCPFCVRADPIVTKILQTYGDRIRFVYRFYPLPSHPNARSAAEAAACADEQGKFWPYHDRLFAAPSKLADADLKQAAVELGLDGPKFNACLDSHEPKARVDADVRAGQEAGVNGTPAFFINGRPLSGAQPFEAFKRVIDEELANR
jgi:protein-disulfide isomerase